MINKVHFGQELNTLSWRSAWSRNFGIPIPRWLFHVTPTWERTTCIFRWSLEREFMYFAGKLVYLIARASNQFAVSVLFLASLLVVPILGCRHSLIRLSNMSRFSQVDCTFFIRPSSDGTYYGMVMSVRPSGSPSVRHSFPHFSLTCFDILIWNFVYHFIVMHVRSSSNAINFRHFLQELCSFLTSNSYKYAVFRTFLLHALTYWVQILYMTLFKCTTEQVWVSSFCFNFCWSYASLWT